MARLKINTPLGLYAAMEKIPSLRSRLAGLDTEEWQLVRSTTYAGWILICDECDRAIAAKDWQKLRSLFALYEGVARGARGSKLSEMYQTAYFRVARDLTLPNNPRDLHNALASAGPALLADIQIERGIRRG